MKRNGSLFSRILASTVLLGLLSGVHPALAQQRTFVLRGASISLQEATTDVDVFFSSMRFNRALNVWNFEVSLTNHSARQLTGPLVLSIDSFTGTTGPVLPDGIDGSGKAFYDLSPTVADGNLVTGIRSLPRTLTIGFNGRAPKLVTRVFVSPAPQPAALALTRTLDEAGQPLPNAQVIETGPKGVLTNSTDPVFGVVTLGQASGSHVWQFSAPGRLSAWRQLTLTTNAVSVVPNPRLPARDTNTFSVTPIAGGSITNSDASIQLSFPPASVLQATTATLTSLTGQTLPAFLPQGWSPLQSFWVELGSEPVLPGAGRFTLTDAPRETETAAFVRWNPSDVRWEVVQVLAGNGSTQISALVPGSGAYSVVVPDVLPTAPPAPLQGSPLAGVNVTAPDPIGFTATGQVQPSTSPASRVPEEVTGTATVSITNGSGPMASGLLLRGQVREAYALRNSFAGLPPSALGQNRTPPQYENFVVAYQRPGVGNPRTLQAQFPLRPLLLFGAEELDQATVTMDVLPPTPFSGGVLDTNGGLVASQGVGVLAGAGDLLSQQAVQLQRLDPTNFSDFATNGLKAISGFELSIAGLASGHHLIAQLAPLPTNGIFVLTRVQYQQGLYGLQPVERLTSDAQGRASTAEPASGERLTGIIGSGQYLLLQVPAPQGLVSGVAKNSAAQPTSGMPVQIPGQPWLAMSGPNGAFQLLAPTGQAQVMVRDLATGDSGLAGVTIADVQSVTLANPTTVSTGPQVISVIPTNGAVNISSVSPISVSFSQPINPATLVAGGMRLLDSNGVTVLGSVTVDLKNTTATLLPTSPLLSGTIYHIALSNAISDPLGRLLQGPHVFTFATRNEVARPESAVLTIFEPGATNIPPDILSQAIGYDPARDREVVVANGSPGTADGQVPVVLVNETSGETVTVLSKVDGSFTSSVRASEEDLISAVFVNANGTRNAVPASRQLFDDGRVGLYQGGGSLNVPSTNGLIQFSVEPGAIRNRAVFKVAPLSTNEVLSKTGNTSPENGQILNGFHLEVTGEIPGGSGSPVFSLDPARLNLPPGRPPEKAAFSLAVPQMVDGQGAFLVVDKMRYQNGQVKRTSFLGVLGFLAGGVAQDFATQLAAMDAVLIFHGHDPVAVQGKIFEANTNGIKTPLAGALVSATPADTQNSLAGRLRPGALYSQSDRDGKYGLLLPVEIGTVNPLSDFPGYFLRVEHPKYSTALTGGLALNTLSAALDLGVFGEDFTFQAGSAVGGGSGSIRLDVSASPTSAATNQPVALLATAFSTGAKPTITFEVVRHVSLVPGIEVQDSDLVTDSDVDSDPGVNIKRKVISLHALKPMQVLAHFQASVAVPNQTQATEDKFLSLNIGAGSGPVPPDAPPADHSDKIPPKVVSMVPQSGDFLPVGGKITVRFSEPVNRSSVNQDGAVVISPDLGAPPGLFLSDDRRTLEITPGRIPASVNKIVVTLNGPPIVDLAQNNLEPFSLTLQTPQPTLFALSGIQSGGGVQALGAYAYALDRGSQPALKVFDIDSLLTSGASAPVATVNLIGFPRDLALIPHWAYRPSLHDPAVTNDLLAVVGGNLGSASVDELGNTFFQGQYLRVFDISKPTQPQRVLGALLTVRPDAINRVLWRPPALIYVESGSDLQHVGVIDLQAMFIGFNATSAEIATFPLQGFDGVQVNSDGDYVDTGEQMPLPQRLPPEFFGKRFGFTLSNPGLIEDVDFDTSGYAGVVVSQSTTNSTVVPASYRTLLSGGSPMLPDQGVFPFHIGARPKRLFALLNQPVRVDANTTVTKSFALVTLAPDSDGSNKVAVLDITQPLTPVSTEIGLSDNLGLPQGITRREDGLLVLSTSTDAVLLDPRLFLTAPASGHLHPAIVGVIAAAGSGNRTLSQSASGLNLVSLGGDNQLVQSAPTLQFVSFPLSTNVVDPDQLRSRPLDEIENILSQQRLLSALPIARFGTNSGVVSSLDPPSPAVHAHVLVDAPGAAGGDSGTIQLTLESLNAGSYPLKNKGRGFPAVRACGSSTLDQLGQKPRDNTDAPIGVLKAFRLSSDRSSHLYNVYLSQPFALMHDEHISISRLKALENNPPRRILWSGAYLRASIDLEQNNGVLSKFENQVDSVQKVIRPPAFVIASSLPGAYVPGNNPPPIGGEVFLPATFGMINALNGEFRHSVVDLELPSPRMPIVFRRTIGGQDHYSGPFGPGWDFNYNQRLIEMKEEIVPPGSREPVRNGQTISQSTIAGSADVKFNDGEGHVVVFKRASDNPPPQEFAQDPLVQSADLGWLQENGGRFYLPDPNCKGVFDLLFRHPSGEFARLTSEGTQYWYDPDGHLSHIYDRYTNNCHVLEYNERHELCRITDTSVNDKRTLEIGHYRLQGDQTKTGPTGLDQTTDSAFVAGQICALKDYTGRVVTYTYNPAGLLEKRIDPKTSSGKNGFGNQSAASPTTTYLYKDPVLGQIMAVVAGNGASGAGASGANAGTPLFSANMTQPDDNDKPVATGGSLPPSPSGGGGKVGISVAQDNSSDTPPSQPSSGQSPEGSTTDYDFDGQGFLHGVRRTGKAASVTTDSNSDASTETRYNAMGLLEFVKYPEQNTVTYTYDTNNPVLRARRNLIGVVVDPGPRGPNKITASWPAQQFDLRYNLPQQMTDFNNNSILYALTSDGRDIEVTTYTGAGKETRHYNDHGQVTFEETPEGVTTTYGYDDSASRFLTSMTRGNEKAVTFQYNQNGSSVAYQLGRPTQITLARANAAPVFLEYDNRLLLTKITQGGFEEDKGYDENGNLVYLERQVGGGTNPYIERRQYNQVNFLQSITVSQAELGGGAKDLITTFTPDETYRVQQITLPEGETQQFEYDHLNQVVKFTTGSYFIQYNRDLHGNVKEVRESGELSRSYTYDGHDRLTSETRNGGSEVITRSYHPNGEFLSQTAQNGSAEDQDILIDIVDSLGRPKHIKITGTKASSEETITYTQGGGLTTVVTGPKDTITTVADSAGRLKSRQDAIGTTTYSIDDDNNLTDVNSTEDNVAYTIHHDYDSLDHRTSYSDGVGTVFTQSPRLDGLPTTITDGLGNPTSQTFSQLGQVLAQNRPESISFQYHFDRDLRATYVGDPLKGNTMLYQPPEGTLRLKELDLPTGDAIKFGSPDNRDLPQAIGLPGGGSRTCSYDTLGRLLSDSSSFHSQAYAQSGLAYDSQDRLRSVKYQTGSGTKNTASYVFDPLGPLSTATYDEPGGPFTLDYGLRSDGVRTSVAHPQSADGLSLMVNEGRDNAGRLLSVTANGPVYSITLYAGAAQPKTALYGGIIQEDNSYDGRRRLTSRRYTRLSDNKVLGEMRYLYDSNDNVIVRQYLHRNGRADTFEYDKANRLIKAGYGARPAIPSAEDQTFAAFPLAGASLKPGLFSRNYKYDTGGLDLLQGADTQNPNAFPSGATGYTIPPFAATIGNEDDFRFAQNVDGLQRAHDELGNTGNTAVYARAAGDADPKRSGADSISYNALSFLVTLKRSFDQVTVNYEYQPNGLIHHRTVTQAGTVVSDTAFVWDSGRLIQEHDLLAKNLRARYFYDDGDSPVAADIRDQNGVLQRFYYLRDYNESILGLADTNGDVVERVSYEAWGQPVIETRDTQPPQLASVQESTNHEILLVMSESVLPPPIAPGSDPDITSSANSLDGLVEINGNAASASYVESGPPFGSTLRVSLPSTITGTFSLHLKSGFLQDEWGNPSADRTVSLTLSGVPATQIFPSSGTVPNTGPRRTARSTVGNPFLFQGQFFDYDAGLVYLRARFYDPYTGAFLQRDPLEFKDSVNAYAGFRHDPTTIRDPSGAIGETLVMAAIRGAGSEAAGEGAEQVITKVARQFAKNVVQARGGVSEIVTGPFRTTVRNLGQRATTAEVKRTLSQSVDQALGAAIRARSANLHPWIVGAHADARVLVARAPELLQRTVEEFDKTSARDLVRVFPNAELTTSTLKGVEKVADEVSWIGLSSRAKVEEKAVILIHEITHSNLRLLTGIAADDSFDALVHETLAWRRQFAFDLLRNSFRGEIEGPTREFLQYGNNALFDRFVLTPSYSGRLGITRQLIETKANQALRMVDTFETY